MALLKPLHREKPIDLQNELTKDLPLVDRDEDRIQQILLSLLGNALKFTESGEVRLSAVVQDGWVEVAVADTGLEAPGKVEPTGDFIGCDDAPSLWIPNLLLDSPEIQRK